MKDLTRTRARSLCLAGMAVGAFMLAPPAFSECLYQVTNNWGSGFTAEITVTNNTSQTVNGWSVSWQESGANVVNAWNANLSGSNPYSATSVGWNGTLAPNASASFGFQANGPAGAPKVSGGLCGSSSSSSSSLPPGSSSSSSSSLSSIVSSSTNQSSSSIPNEGVWIIEEDAVGFCGGSGSVYNNHSGYTDIGFIDTENAVGAEINWSVSAASNQQHSVAFRFANGSASARGATLLINNNPLQAVSFPVTGAWNQWQTLALNVPLNAGTNSIKLVAETAGGLPNMDNLSITGNGIAPAACPTSPPPSSDCNSVTNQPILRVAADGSGQYRTVQAALNTLSNSNSTPTQIRIKSGVYREKLTVTKPFVTFCGETGKQASTVLTYNDTSSTPNGSGGTLGTSGSTSVLITANDVSVENITIENSHGPGIQAVALRVNAERVQFRNCRLLGYQDTLYVHGGSQYFRDCHIQGSVDFIFGGATAVFENNTIHSVSGGTALTAPSTDQNRPYGLVFLGGEVTAVSGVARGSVALGRNWRPYGAAAYIRTRLGEHISPVGWVRMGDNTLDTARFSEYLSTGAGANPSARASQSQQLSSAQAATYTIGNIFGSWVPGFSQ